MTTNGQSPFVTLFLHIDENDEYVEETVQIIMEILRQRIEGTKNEKGVYVTPAFPKLVYVLDENNCLKGGKYDYVTKLAAQCSAKRMYPDYISAKKMRENYEGNVFSCMGCRSFLSPWKDETESTSGKAVLIRALSASTCPRSVSWQKEMRRSSGNCWMSVWSCAMKH